MPDIFKSKKFWVAVVGAIAEVLFVQFDFPTESTITIGGIIIAYIFGQGIADHGKEKAKIEKG